jgi:uncharacterized protein (DUF305 family)
LPLQHSEQAVFMDLPCTKEGKQMKFTVKLIGLMFVLVFGLVACAPAPTTGDLPRTGEELDQLFIDMMVPHHEGALEMARIALERSQRSEIREMAEAIIASQDAEISQMRAWRLEWFGSSQTPSMSEMPSMEEMPGHGAVGHAMDMQAEVDALRSAPEPFDLAFIDAMIPHHLSAIDAAVLLKEATQRPELMAMADAIIAEQQREVDLMMAWREMWYPDEEMPASHGH